MFMKNFYDEGFLPDDPRIQTLLEKISHLHEYVISKTDFFNLIESEASEIERLLFHPTIIPNF
jgi:glutaminase